MGRLKEIDPSQTRLFAKARQNEIPIEAEFRLMPQYLPVSANVLDGVLEVEPGVVMQLSGGVGVAQEGELFVNDGAELVLGEGAKA